LTWGDFLVGLSVGLVVAAGAYGVLRWRFQRAVAERARRARRRLATSTSIVPPALGPAVVDPPALAHAAAEGAPVAAGIIRTEPRPPVNAPVPAASRSGAAPGRIGGNEDEPMLRLSQRVLLHLLRNGSASAAGEAVTQRGIMAALNSSQGALSSVLRRLEDGGAIASEKTHVGGRDRRVKVYTLTPRGRGLVAAAPRAAENQGATGRSPSPGPSTTPTS
jgi:DNA-binding MarR family transcriptional regulator